MIHVNDEFTKCERDKLLEDENNEETVQEQQE